MLALLSESIERYTTDNYDFQKRHALLKGNQSYSEGAWKDYAEFGWLALTLGEDLGGLDADATTLGPLMEVVGYRLLMEPILSSAVIGTRLVSLLGGAEQRDRILPTLIDGSVKLAVLDLGTPRSQWLTAPDNRLTGTAPMVLHGDVADKFIVPAVNADGEVQVYVVEAVDCVRKNYRLVDGRGAASVDFQRVVAQRLGTDNNGARVEAVLADVADEAVVALCGETFGIVTALVNATGNYLKVRKQFGKALSTNQALQHRMADMYMIQQEVGALTNAARLSMDQPRADRTRIISGARAYIGRAARIVGNEAVQMHGGIGITEELDVSHYFRRLIVNAALLGSLDRHFENFVQLTLADSKGLN
ncbi:acyl-CoA dehydrogenase family protein [Burkholderia sp. FL-7-2-10-S1-D7]|uniref:acyl-CoA dehydrogenase family protein n=1 Tax=Burkholderia sp. FL-7-2-10-S1-D7 TaxID=1637866 RepID=UPI00211D9E85|nr:acyl-CoA dehydrogenase family protein [Burkholderia sp. FL-7-2-10-S1-D7]